MKELDITYDWTYSTDYKGSLQRFMQSKGSRVTLTRRDGEVKVEATAERIDYEKLKEREPILWFEDVSLYEDELHDHGISAMSVKVVSFATYSVYIIVLNLTPLVLFLAARNVVGILRVVTLLDAIGSRCCTSA